MGTRQGEEFVELPNFRASGELIDYPGFHLASSRLENNRPQSQMKKESGIITKQLAYLCIARLNMRSILVSVSIERALASLALSIA